MRQSLLLCAGLAAGVALVGCSADPAPEAVEAPAASTPATAPGAPPPIGGHGFGPEISAEDFAAHVSVLASDAFLGRAPGSDGERLTVEYLEGEFRRLGLEPGIDGSYLQQVAMVETTADPSTTLSLSVGGETRTLPFGADMVIGTRTGQAEVSLADSPLVFVGYGVNAPEAGWNDYAGLDVRGKTVVILVNDPGFHAGDEALFEGRRMTYYGRWTYKFEEAARQGAAAALIVHDTEGAGYGWEVVQNSWSGPQFDLPAEGDPEPRLPMQGWLSAEEASSLFAAAGQDFMALRAAANQPGFRAVELPATASAQLRSTVTSKTSANVVARLPGASAPDEAVLYMAHWDHLGAHDGPAGEDHIYNGAIDNATGVAGVLEIAERFVTAGTPPERSVYFAMVTLEESGLLGSKYLMQHPPVPLADIAGVINLDAMPVVGPTRDFVVVGMGSSELEDILSPIAALQGRTLEPESAPEKGFYFRSDHFNFAKAGVPALYAKGGDDHVELGEAYGQQIAADYTGVRYHKPADHWDPEWDLRGVVQDLDALYGVGMELSKAGRWPTWYEGHPFKAARDASRADR